MRAAKEVLGILAPLTVRGTRRATAAWRLNTNRRWMSFARSLPLSGKSLGSASCPLRPLPNRRLTSCARLPRSTPAGPQQVAPECAPTLTDHTARRDVGPSRSSSAGSARRSATSVCDLVFNSLPAFHFDFSCYAHPSRQQAATSFHDGCQCFTALQSRAPGSPLPLFSGRLFWLAL